MLGTTTYLGPDGTIGLVGLVYRDDEPVAVYHSEHRHGEVIVKREIPSHDFEQLLDFMGTIVTAWRQRGFVPDLT